MIPVEKFLQCIRENAARVHAYESGHDGSDGKCDCIGLIIGALALAGFKWPGVHGSNWAARNAMDSLQYIPDATEIYVGEIVYKAKEPGESGYSLPSRYIDSVDLRDYYHVGVVTQTAPLVITHCTSVDGGIQRDGKAGNWRWGGKLKYVNYNGQEGTDMEVLYSAKVTADSGKTVNVRAKPDVRSTITDRVEIGENVTVLDELGDWDKVIANGGKTGYMMAKYLIPAIEDEPDEETVTVGREMLETWAEVLEEMARDIRDLLGHG